MKYKAGGKVRIIGDNNNNFQEMGSIVKIEEIRGASNWSPQCYVIEGDWLILEEDCELYEEKEESILTSGELPIKDPSVVEIKTYTITSEIMSDGTIKTIIDCEGFNQFELLGVLTLVTDEIKEEIKFKKKD